MKYSELHYERINVDEVKVVISDIVKRFSDAKSVKEQISSILELDKIGRDYASYSSIASLNFSRDIHNEKAKAEKDYYDSIGPDMEECFNSFEINFRIIFKIFNSSTLFFKIFVFSFNNISEFFDKIL